MFNKRLQREFISLERSPPYGVAAWPIENKLDQLNAQIIGPVDTPYENGLFMLSIFIPTRYPYEPPKVKFLTKIYHPNISNEGVICLDTLNLPPKGAWTPSLNISTLLTMIRQLLISPNGDDGLVYEITQKFKYNRHEFDQIAKQWTKNYATNQHVTSNTCTKIDKKDQQIVKRRKLDNSYKEEEKKVIKDYETSSDNEDSEPSDEF